MAKTTGKYAVPQEIRDQKPRGTMVKKISGKYYVYEMKNIKDPQTGKWKIKTGRVLGKITEEDGYMPNEDRGYTILEYGSYYLAEKCSTDIKEKFIQAFGKNDTAKRIWTLAVLYAVNGFRAISAIGTLYEKSVLSLYYPGLKMGRTALSNQLDNLGRRNTESLKFQELISETTNKVAIDGHVIPRYSKRDGMTEYGYKYRELGTEQINLLTAIDVANNHPIAMKMFDGSKTDKVSVKELIGDISIKECLYLMDRGFYSRELKDIIASRNSTYIMPLSPNLTLWKKASKRPRGRLKSFVYSRKDGIHTRRDVIEYHVSKTEGNTRVIAFWNTQEAVNMKAKYLDLIEKGVSGYTENELIEAEKTFGLIVLETTHDGAPDEIYKLYKERWHIETYFDYLKHQMDFNALGVQDWAKLQGLAFMMLLATLISGSVKEKLQTSAMKNVYMPETWLTASSIKAINQNEKWVVENATKKERELFDALNIEIEKKVGNLKF